MSTSTDDVRYIVTGVAGRFPETALPRPRVFPRRRSLSATRAPHNVRFTDERVTINAGGVRFQTFRATLRRHQGTLLYDLSESSKFFDEQKQEFFFDRSSGLFESILNYYRTGELHFADGACAVAIRRELLFWRVPEDALDDCCWLRCCEEDDVRKRRAHLRDVVTTARAAQEAAVEQLEDMPPVDKGKVTQKLFEALHVSSVYPDLRLLFAALHSCGRELALFAAVLLSSVFAFAVFIRILEGPEVIPNFFGAIWWALVTMTTVGGAAPRSYLGTVVGMVAVVVGVVAVTLPLPLVTRRLLDMKRLLEENARLDARSDGGGGKGGVDGKDGGKVHEVGGVYGHHRVREGMILSARGRDPNKKKM